MQSLVSFTSASSFVKENNHVTVMKYLPDTIKQLKSCPKSLRKSIIHWMYFKAVMAVIGLAFGSAMGSGLVKVLVELIRK